MLIHSPELVQQILYPPNYRPYITAEDVEGEVNDLLHHYLANNINYIHNMQHRYDLIDEADPKLLEALIEEVGLKRLNNML